MRGACPANTERIENFDSSNDKSNQRIVGAEFQSTVEAELFFIHPVRNTVDYRILFAIFCDLAFAVAVKQLNKKYVIVAYKCNQYGTVRRKKTGTC